MTDAGVVAAEILGEQRYPPALPVNAGARFGFLDPVSVALDVERDEFHIHPVRAFVCPQIDPRAGRCGILVDHHPAATCDIDVVDEIAGLNNSGLRQILEDPFQGIRRHERDGRAQRCSPKIQRRAA